MGSQDSQDWESSRVCTVQWDFFYTSKKLNGILKAVPNFWEIFPGLEPPNMRGKFIGPFLFYALVFRSFKPGKISQKLGTHWKRWLNFRVLFYFLEYITIWPSLSGGSQDWEILPGSVDRYMKGLGFMISQTQNIDKHYTISVPWFSKRQRQFSIEESSRFV